MLCCCASSLSWPVRSPFESTNAQPPTPPPTKPSRYQGRTYLCKKLDLDARVAVVRPADLKYYTKCIDYTDVHVRGGKAAYKPAPATPAAAAPPVGAAAAARPGGERPPASAGQQQQQEQQQGQEQALTALCSPALVTTRWLGFRRIWRGTGEGGRHAWRQSPAC